MSRFASWQRFVAAFLVSVFVLNTGLFSGAAHAETFEVKLDDFRDFALEELQEFGLVAVVVEDALLESSGVATDLRAYCTRVQRQTGSACMLLPWQGESPSRIVEALQQLYFEGVEVKDGLAKLVGLVLVGEVPLPILHRGGESFPSMLPYTDLVEPAFVFDADAEKFTAADNVFTPQSEVWHGVIRPPGEGEERVENLRQYMARNARFYAGDQELITVDNAIGFHDHFWENSAFDNEAKRWYLEKMSVLDRLYHYRYTGDWLAELSGEAEERLDQLTSRTFEDAGVSVDGPDAAAVDAEIGFSQADVDRQRSRATQGLDNEDEDASLKQNAPDHFAPGAIRNFLKDYVHTVQRYISGTSDIFAGLGRRQRGETMASLITSLDKFYGSIIFLITQEYERYFFGELDKVDMEFDLVSKFEELNDFYTEELNDLQEELTAKLSGDASDAAPTHIKSIPKDNVRRFGSEETGRFASGVAVNLVNDAQTCSLERGSNFLTPDGEPGRLITLNRKENPLTSQDIADVESEEEIELVQRSYGFCTYPVRDLCKPAESWRPIFDYGASELLDADNSYLRCYEHEGATPPKDVETSEFHDIPSIIDHTQPTGEVVREMFEARTAHFLPIDAVRHVSWYWGGPNPRTEQQVGRFDYPNFFDVRFPEEEIVQQTLDEILTAKEREMRKIRVEANWQRFAGFVSLSSSAAGRPDFWNYHDMPGFAGQFEGYKRRVTEILREAFDLPADVEDFEVIEQYLEADQISEEVQEELIELFEASFPAALANDPAPECSYTFDVPPIDVGFESPEIDQSDIFSPAIFLPPIPIPKFNPPAIKRECNNQYAKNTVDQLRTLRQFYQKKSGAQVNVTILHDADKNVEILDPVAVILYFTPVPPPLPPNTNMIEAIRRFQEQADDLAAGIQPTSQVSKVYEPVELISPGELQALRQQYDDLLQESLRWLNLSIEAKHKEAMVRLAEKKEMVYLVLKGDSTTVDFTMDALQGTFDPDADQGIASDPDLLDEIRERSENLQKKQDEARERRSAERREDGEKPSECGDSAPLLQWPGAVLCWLDEIMAGPLIIPVEEGEDGEDRYADDPNADPGEDDPSAEERKSSVRRLADSVPRGEIAVSQTVLTVRDRTRAAINLPLAVEVTWEGDEVVQVVPDRDGEVAIVPQKLGVGRITASFQQGQQIERSVASVRVVDRKAVLQQLSNGDLQAGVDEPIQFQVEIRDGNDQLVVLNTNLEPQVQDEGVVRLPEVVPVVGGVGEFELRAGTVAKLSGFALGSDDVARSEFFPVSVVAGEPARLEWDFGDAIVGLDGEISGKLRVLDRFGNPYRSEGLRVQLSWPEDMIVNNEPGPTAFFFLVGGELDVEVTFTEELLERARERAEELVQPLSGDPGSGPGTILTSQRNYGYSLDSEDEESGGGLSELFGFGGSSPIGSLPDLELEVTEVIGFPDFALPDPVELDLDQGYRLQFVGDLPSQISADENIPVEVRVVLNDQPVRLQEKMLVLDKEFAGQIERFDIPLPRRGRIQVPSGPVAGTVTLSIDDPDFGSLVHSVEVVGEQASSISLDEARYERGRVDFVVSGRDPFGNLGSLQGKVARVTLTADGGETAGEQSFAIEEEVLSTSIPVDRLTDRLRIEVQVSGFEERPQMVLPMVQELTTEDFEKMPWESPYTILMGGTYGDYRVPDAIAPALLFGENSELQAVTTELTPHRGYERLLKIWPSGRVEVGPEANAEVILESFKPVLVFSDVEGEVGRLKINPKELDFELVNSPFGDFRWTAFAGKGRSMLVPDQSEVKESDDELMLTSDTGRELVIFNDAGVDLLDDEVELVLEDSFQDVLVLLFQKNSDELARWYIHLDVAAVDDLESGSLGPLFWEFSQPRRTFFDRERFYAGESTADERGLLILKKGETLRYGVGRGREALDDVYSNNGEGFVDEDKVVLSFLAGNSVGESTRLQSEGIVNYGDPVISLRQVQHDEEGAVIPALQEGEVAAAQDFSVGQLVYAPGEGVISQILRLDVEKDDEDDLLVVLRNGDQSHIEYLEGMGEGKRWGRVTRLLNLGQGVVDVQSAQGEHLVVLYQNGLVALEVNEGGRFRHQGVDFTALKPQLQVIDLQVRDFDLDGIDDLLFLTGDRELWLWYGTRRGVGLVFGQEERDRLRLKVVPVRLQEPENLKSAVWIYTPQTPVFELGCAPQERPSCNPKYFRSFVPNRDGESEEIDRLQTLIEQAEQPRIFDPSEVDEQQQNYLARLDKVSGYNSAIDIELLNADEGTNLNLNQELRVEMRIRPPRSEDLVMRFDLGQDFELASSVECEGCGEDLRILTPPQSLWSLEGSTRAGREIVLSFSLSYQTFPDFSFQVMFTNEDQFPDVGINVDANPTAAITVFESRGAREYTETIFGQRPLSSSNQQRSDASELADLLRGIGLQGKSEDQIRQMLLDQQEQVAAEAGGLLDDLYVDDNFDGYPDTFQENPNILPRDFIEVDDGEPSLFEQLDLFGFVLDRLVPKAHAQGQSITNESNAIGQQLGNSQNLLNNSRTAVDSIVNLMKCSRGCLPLPLNFAFLAPGPINVAGTPAGFDPGLPVFAWGVPSLIPVWPPSPYQAALGGSLYLSPTLTGGLGIGLCIGPYLLGQCFVFSVPIAQLAGSESVCDAVKEGLGGLVSGINSAIGQVNAAGQQISSAASQTGVVKASNNTANLEEIESIIGVSLGGGTHSKGVTPHDNKVTLSGVPKAFVDWWDRQWEEIVNSLTDLPDITVRVPNLRDAWGDGEHYDKVYDKFELLADQNFFNLQQIYDLINSLPVITLNAQTLQIQVPWIEPGILHRMEQSLYRFMNGFMLEFLAFMRSFNLPCNITATRAEFFGEVERKIQGGLSDANRKRIVEAKARLDDTGKDLVQRQRELNQFLAENNIDADPSAYFNELREKENRVNQMFERYADAEDEINRLKQPEKITDAFEVFVEVVQQSVEFWLEQLSQLDSEALASGAEREGVGALRSCVAIQIAADVGVDATAFLDGIQKNLEALEKWQKFPRQLADYLNIVEFYLSEIAKTLDQVTSVVLKWWGEFERRLDLWLDAISSFQEFVALIKALIDILKGYNKNCGLCTSDRLTLKDLILKLLFGVVPDFPIIDFPTWPDVLLDFSDIEMAMNVSVPVFDVRTVDLKWPELPTIQFPRFEDISISAGGELSLGFSVALPAIPEIIPEPPVLPPLQPLPNFPQLNLPNLPPAPEVPEVLEALLPLMQIIQTILDIWCLVNKSLIPFDEKQLKTQIENLTNRSGNLILPLDVALNFELNPGALIQDNQPFDLIKVVTESQLDVNIDPAASIQQQIDQNFHQPINTMVGLIDQYMRQLRNSVQPGINALSDSAQNLIDEFDVDDVQFQTEPLDAQIDADLQRQFPGLPDLQSLVPDQLSPLAQERRQLQEMTHDLIAVRQVEQQQYLKEMQFNVSELRRSLAQLTAQEPERILAQLAENPNGNALVKGDTSSSVTGWLRDARQERQQALREETITKQIALVNRPFVLSQLEVTRTGLQDVQDELLGTNNESLQQFGTAVVRNGEVRRLQDYPLEDPAVYVWENDVFVGYEKALYVKTSDNKERQTDPYEGRVLEGAFQDFQRSKVHHLQGASVASAEVGAGLATMRWSWDAPGVTDVELTVWDDVTAAQGREADHRRYYLHVDETDPSLFFASPTTGFELEENQQLEAQREVVLEFGRDRVIIPRGMRFTVPSLILRRVELEGDGLVALENFSGLEWSFDLQDGAQLTMNGVAELTSDEAGLVRIPALEQRPVVTRVGRSDEPSRGLLRPRRDVGPDEELPVGIFLASRDVQLRQIDSGALLGLEQGMTFSVEQAGRWMLEQGRGQVALGDEASEEAELSTGTVLLDGEEVQGALVIQDGALRRELLPEQRVLWDTVSEAVYEVTLPVAHYYGRIRDDQGKRGFSPIVLAGASLDQADFGTAQLVPGLQKISVPIYTPFSVDGGDFVFGQVSEESFHWRLETAEELVNIREFSHPGFPSVGTRSLELFVRDGVNGVATKPFEVEVFIPELVIDEDLFADERILRVDTVPPVANVPIGIVGERDDLQDWLLSSADEGVRDGERYRANAEGFVQLQPLDDIEGLNIVIENGLAVARLYPTGRVTLNPGFEERCERDAFLDRDGYLKFKVRCREDGAMVNKFEVRTLPDLDTDVTIVDEFSVFDSGVVIRSLQSSVELTALGVNADFAPGGAQVGIRDREVLMVLARDGQVDLARPDLDVREKAFVDPTEPLVWELVQEGAILAEFQIKAPEDIIEIIDPQVRDEVRGDADGDGMLDSWEEAFELSDPNGDEDQDGLRNVDEFLAGSHPRDPDTDGDGLLDGEEVDPVSAGSTKLRIRFNDVQEGSPYFEAIMGLAELGFIQGFGDGSFRPDQAVTRAEAIKILMSVIRCENCEFPSDETKNQFIPTDRDFDYFVDFHRGVFDQSSEDPLRNFAFSADQVRNKDDVIRTYLDVEIDDWFYYCIEIATELGLIHGYRGFEDGVNALGRFIPTRGVNIAELMKMVIEAIGDNGKESDRVFGPPEGWWNDPFNNYLATAEEDLQLLLDAEDYLNPLREATRAEVAYAAYRVLRENGVLDFDNDGVSNQADSCPCTPAQLDDGTPINGCPAGALGPVVPRERDFFEGIEITQFLTCRCLVLIDPDLFAGSRFFAVITGVDEEEEKVFAKSNEVLSPEASPVKIGRISEE